MWCSAIVSVLGLYLVTTVALFPQSRLSSALAVVGGALAALFAIARPYYDRALDRAALVAFVLAVSALAIGDSPLVDWNRVSVGAVMFVCAVAPSPKRLGPGEAPH
jgi:hypothetical protein